MESVEAYALAHKMWAGPILGVMVFLESLAVVDLLVPATTLVLATGGFIGAGLLDPGPLIVWAVAGAVAGDWVSYIVGRKIGPSVYRIRPFRKERRKLAAARLFFHRYGFVSVFAGRFVGPLRATVPLVAGVMQTERRSFQAANILSAALWVPLLLAPGYIAARQGQPDQFRPTHALLLGLVIAAAASAVTVVGAYVLRSRRAHRKGAQ